MSDMPRRKRRTFTQEQEAAAVRLARETGNIAHVVRDLDPYANSLHKWIKRSGPGKRSQPAGYDFSEPELQAKWPQ